MTYRYKCGKLWIWISIKTIRTEINTMWENRKKSVYLITKAGLSLI